MLSRIEVSVYCWPMWNIHMQILISAVKMLRLIDKTFNWCSSLSQQISQASKPVVKAFGLWGSVKALSRGYEYLMSIVIFVPVAVLAWFPFVSEFQTRLLFNQAFSRGLQISRILAGGKKQRWGCRRCLYVQVRRGISSRIVVHS